MPLVFVHGVNVRDGPDSVAHVRERDALFRRFVLAPFVTEPHPAPPLNPYWGDAAAKFHWQHASLPTPSVETLGVSEALTLLLLSEVLTEEALDPQQVIMTVAHRSLTEAIDLLWAVGGGHVADARAADDLADLALRVSDYADHNPRPAWLDTARNDQQFISHLIQDVKAWQPAEEVGLAPPLQKWETLGADKAWDPIQIARLQIQSLVSRSIGQRWLDRVRPVAHQFVARFIGDAFTYFTQRGTADQPGPIVTRVAQALEQARHLVCPGDPCLIVVGHSMGGNILYDLLTYFRPDLQVDALVTVGSQVALFEEMKLFKVSDTGVPNAHTARVAKPTNVRHWLNIFDDMDLFAFATERVFASTSDFSYDTRRGLFEIILSHSSYFLKPSFHQRLAAHLRETLR